MCREGKMINRSGRRKARMTGGEEPVKQVFVMETSLNAPEDDSQNIQTIEHLKKEKRERTHKNFQFFFRFFAYLLKHGKHDPF